MGCCLGKGQGTARDAREDPLLKKGWQDGCPGGASGPSKPPPPLTGQVDPAFKKKCEDFYRHYAPEKVSTVPDMIAKRQGNQSELDEMFSKMVAKYGPWPPEGHPFKERLRRYYEKYAPDKVGNLDATFDGWHYRQDEYFAQMVPKHGPEPPDLEASEPATGEPARKGGRTTPKQSKPKRGSPRTSPRASMNADDFKPPKPRGSPKSSPRASMNADDFQPPLAKEEAKLEEVQPAPAAEGDEEAKAAS